MRGCKTCLSLFFTAALCGSANAGAWTQPEGDLLVINTMMFSEAKNSFDDDARPDVPIKFSKLYASAYAEYGLRDGWTALLVPEFSRASWSQPGATPVRSQDFAVGGGLRTRLFDSFGVLSAQAMLKTAGAHDSSATTDVASGRQAEFRLLYGTNFDLCGASGFADIEIGQRFIDGPQPDETPIDVTVGVRVADGVQILAQSFNTISASNGAPGFGYYRSHKVQFSAVVDLTDGVSLQAGGFFSPAGQNALDERGVFIGIWNRL